LSALKNGAEDADFDLLLEIVEQVREHDVKVAEELKRLTEGYEYDEILTIIQQGTTW
jgi:hypothetical protein